MIQSDIYEQAFDGASAEEIERVAIEDILETVDKEGNAIYGIYLETYGRTGNITRSIYNEHLSCVWRESNEEGIGEEWYALEDYFTLDELSGFFSYYTENGRNHTGRTGCYIQKMTGYYKNGKYVPIEIVFADRNAKNDIYILKNAERMKTIKLSRRVYRVGEITQDNLDELNGTNETNMGYFTLYVYKPKDKLYREVSAYSTISSTNVIQGYDESSDTLGKVSIWRQQLSGAGGVFGYTCVIGADIKAMVRNSGNLGKVIPPLVIFFQGVAVLAIWVYLYVRGKQEKFANMRNTFINAIAHEMKTPAAVIKNSIECLQAGIHPEKQEHYIEMINRETEHMNDLLNSMLTYTRVTDSVCKIQREEYSLGKMAEDVCEHYTDVIERKKISLIWDRNDLGQVLCDVKLMEMVLDNFVSNAVKFCKEGGVIRISLTEKSIGIFNEGQEMAEEEMEHIWEPLYRGDESRTREDGSSGMGLAISEAILKIHGADYGVKNVSGGVEFYLHLK